MKGPDYLLCMFWGMQVIPSQRIRCSRCPNLLALDAGNVGVLLFPDMLPICAECFLRIVDPVFGGVAVGGQLVETEKIAAPPKMVEYARDVVKRWKVIRN